MKGGTHRKKEENQGYELSVETCWRDTRPLATFGTPYLYQRIREREGGPGKKEEGDAHTFVVHGGENVNGRSYSGLGLS